MCVNTELVLTECPLEASTPSVVSGRVAFQFSYQSAICWEANAQDDKNFLEPCSLLSDSARGWRKQGGGLRSGCRGSLLCHLT